VRALGVFGFFGLGLGSGLVGFCLGGLAVEGLRVDCLGVGGLGVTRLATSDFGSAAGLAAACATKTGATVSILFSRM